MKSDIIKLTGDIDSLKAVLSETEKTASYAQLDKKQGGRLRLLSEELVEMLPSLLAFSVGEFWIDCDGKSFELHTSLTPNEAMTSERRDELLSVSKSGKNAAATGIMAKIRLAATFMMIDYEKNAAEMPADYGFYHDGMGGSSYFTTSAWSLSAYRMNAGKEKGEEWDELEKSIVANLADDVLVGVEGKKVEIIVKKNFGS